MPIYSFRELIVWQKAHALVLEIYRIAEKFPKSELFGISLQMRRCAVSVPSNLAEGFKRQSPRDCRRFYNIAEGSLEELKYQLILAHDLRYLESDDYDSIENLADEVGRLIAGWKKSQR
jgi:four helix bundle protein